ncbi:GatB/YqeY domain-containing protein [Dacryopinax primogenitus]|uniref:Altered inheritance of mitochondria protein 41 n=1 Tax=Dacryopinax primogenitus (strain DJM 731) TaxID=1858805 RepID=M5FPW3_DACPD|nr:GatB/YqeY domain-containing protein [Dacryopinax primogenitus]EJT97358.1 GatB/YqeY domain-containing protein [Dacryopinax primogenitus]
MYRALLPYPSRFAVSRATLPAIRWNFSTALGGAQPLALRAQLQQGLKAAMKAKDSVKATVIRSVIADVVNTDKASKSGEAVGTPEVLRALQQGITRREDAQKQYLQGDRPDLAQATEAEITILRSFVPPQLAESEVDVRIARVLEEMKDRGEKVVMGGVMKRFWEGTGKEEISAQLVSERVKLALAKEQ